MLLIIGVSRYEAVTDRNGVLITETKTAVI